MAGTLLLMLPVSSADGEVTGFIPSLFTATSASCRDGPRHGGHGHALVLLRPGGRAGAYPDRRPRLHDHRDALLEAREAPHEHTRARRHGRLDKLERLRPHHGDNLHDWLGHALLRRRGRALAVHTLHTGARILGRALVRDFPLRHGLLQRGLRHHRQLRLPHRLLRRLARLRHHHGAYHDRRHRLSSSGTT